MIDDFIWKSDQEFFTWFLNGKQQLKQFQRVLQSVVKLADGLGFAVVGSYEEFGMNNAFILNEDGTERYLLDIPKSITNPICFHEIYYIGSELTAIIVNQGVDFACVVDSNTGLYGKTYETR
jgi:hypothetical protein